LAILRWSDVRVRGRVYAGNSADLQTNIMNELHVVSQHVICAGVRDTLRCNYRTNPNPNQVTLTQVTLTQVTLT
jgi:hypothetical protein